MYLFLGWNLQKRSSTRYHISDKRVKKFGNTAQEEWFIVNFDQDWHGKNIANILKDMERLFVDILQQVRDQGVKDSDLCRVHVSHPDLISKGDIKVEMRPFQEMVPEAILDAVENHIQSNDKVVLDEQFEVAVGVIRVPEGGGRIKITNPDLDKKLKRSIVTITNDDDLCLARSLVVCRAYQQYKAGTITYNQYKLVKNSCRPTQKREAIALQTAAGLPTHEYKASLHDIAHFGEKMDAQIIVISAVHHNKIIYAGPHKQETKYFLYYTENKGNYYFVHIFTQLNS